MRIERDEPDGFRATLVQAHVGFVTPTSVEAQAHRASRDLAMVRRASAGLVYINVPLVGSLTGRQHARDLVPVGGRLGMIVDHEPATVAADADFRQLVVGIPAELVVPRLAEAAVSRVVAGALAGLLAQLVGYLFAHAPEFSGADARQASIHVTDLVIDCFGSGNSEQQRASAGVILQAAMDEAERRLADAALDTEALARFSNVSRRTLEKLFADRGTTVARWILQRRLEHARWDLESDRFVGAPVESVAQRWAFADRTHFSRVFRERYGRSPAEYRRTVSNKAC